MHEEITAAARTTPAVGGALYASLTLNDWAAIATIAYVGLQIVLLIPKYRAAFPAFWAKAKAFLAARLDTLRRKLAEGWAALRLKVTGK